MTVMVAAGLAQGGLEHRNGHCEELIELWRCTGVRLVLVCHAPRLPRGLHHTLSGVPHSVTDAVDDVLGPPAAQVPTPRRPEPAPTALPAVPASDVAWFRADAFRTLTRADFARVDAVYTHGVAAACRWLQPSRPPTSPAACSTPPATCST